MLTYIWAGMILLSILFAAFTGNLQGTMDALLSSADSAVTMVIKLVGIMCFWTGLMNIAEKSGLTKVFAKCLRPLTRLIFPSIPQHSKAMHAIVLNMVANIFGLSNAATPLGLTAMKELKSLSHEGNTATNAMCMFVVINTASISLVPSTVIALRSAAGSANPFEIILPVWCASICAAIAGITFAKLFERRNQAVPIQIKKAA